MINLPRELEHLKESLPSLIEKMERHVPYAAALVQQQSGQTITLGSHEQNAEPADPRAGIVLSAWTGNHFVEHATSELNPNRVADIAQEFVASLRVEDDGISIDPGEAMERQYATECEIDPITIPLKEKFQACLDLQQRMAALDPRIVNARVTFKEESETKVFANRNRLLQQRVQRSRVMMLLLVHENGSTAFDWAKQEGTRGFEVMTVSDDTLQALRDSALTVLHAERIEPGFYECISCPGVSGFIAHEAFGHGVELDMFLKGRARASEYLGKQIAAPIVSMVDNPLFSGGYGGFFFDDEGEPARPITIIRNGILESGLGDFRSCVQLDTPRTASGRRESFARKPYSRMSNTYFLSGESDPQDMIASVEKGIYLEHGSSGMEDPKDWGIQVICHFGREIADGEFSGRAFAPVGLTGFVPDVLKSISMVGSDLSLVGGYCGKGYKEVVPSGTGGPHLKFQARLG